MGVMKRHLPFTGLRKEQLKSIDGSQALVVRYGRPEVRISVEMRSERARRRDLDPINFDD